MAMNIDDKITADMTPSKDKGYTLVEITLVMVLLGVFISFAIAVFMPIYKSSRKIATEAKLEVIADAIAVYAQRNYRLPCPADPEGDGPEPFGAERDSGAAGDSIDTSCTGADAEGIIPFRTLNLGQEQVQDAWGGWITYRVSPAYAVNPDDVTAAQYNEVHQACRLPAWFDPDEINNIHPAKARFCCALRTPAAYAPTQDTDVQDADNISLWPYARGDTIGDYDNVNSIVLEADRDPVDNDTLVLNTAVAYVIISHGENQFGAYTGLGVPTRFTGGGLTTGTEEGENQDNDNLFRILGYNSSDSNAYFDDIIVWRTQEQVMAEFGDDTCWRP